MSNKQTVEEAAMMLLNISRDKYSIDVEEERGFLFGAEEGIAWQKEQDAATLKQLLEALQEVVKEAEIKMEAGKRAADRHNNTPGVVTSFDYMSYPPEPKWLKDAKAAISLALD